MKDIISITGIGSISPLGDTLEKVWKSYLDKEKHFISVKSFNGSLEATGSLDNTSSTLLDELRNSFSHYKNVDKTVLMGIYAGRQALKDARWKSGNHFGINMGSSRGATGLFEQYHSEFLDTKKAATLSSPTTTLGNIATWLSNDLQSKGPTISHSITCSTALHSITNGVAWLQSGMCDKFMVGGSEAPLTPFTIAQMKSLKIYTQSPEERYPCRTLDMNKQKNQMFLGEGAAVFCLEKGKQPGAKAYITGIGYATEPLKHNISISTNADCFQDSMKMAIGNETTETIDAIVMHAPGTIKGDLSEYNAIQAVFGNKKPLLTSNKWKIGHSFGASGALSIELAILMLQNQEFIEVPFSKVPIKTNTPLRNILVNAVGFGGNAVTVKLSIV